MGGLAWSLPADLAMVAGGLATGVTLGVAGGLVVAGRPGTAPARVLHGLSAVGLSPRTGSASWCWSCSRRGRGTCCRVPFLSGLMDYRPLTADPLAWLKALWLPWLLVGFPLAAQVLRMTAGSVREASGEDFLRTAHAKGLRERRVLVRHALPLATAPVAALSAANVAALVTNVALIESAFNIPGIYREIGAIGSAADYELLQGMIIETTVLIVGASMLADALHARMDPRVT